MCSKKEIYGSIILAHYCLIKSAWQKLGEDRRLGDCHRRISSMVSPYRCTVKACNQVMDVAGVSHKQVRHSYSYYMITYLYFWCSRWIVTHTVIDTTCTQIESIVTWQMLLGAFIRSFWGQLVDPEFEHSQQTLFWQTVYIVLEMS